MAEDEVQRRTPRWRTRLMALFFGLIVAFIAGEVTLRLTQPLVDLDVMTGRNAGPNPLSRWAQEDAFSAYRAIPDAEGRSGKTVNSEGFMSTPELSPEKEAGVLRIAFLGGSSTAGTGFNLSDRGTWPWRVADLLRKDFPDRRIEHLNGALGGYTSFESYGRLWSRIRFFRPDVVVVNHAWNDMYYFGRADKMHRFRVHDDGGWNLSRNVVWAEFPPHWIDPWIGWSCLLTHVRRWVTPKRGEVSAEHEQLAGDYDERAIDVYRTNLRLMRDAQAALGFRLFCVKQPTLIVRDLPEKLRAKCGYAMHGFDHDAHVRAFAEIYRVIDEEMPPDRIIDLTPLSGRPDIFFDHVHPTGKGAGEIATLVARRLASAIR
jgi:lysophospholipase L1-like esterase